MSKAPEFTWRPLNKYCRRGPRSGGPPLWTLVELAQHIGAHSPSLCSTFGNDPDRPEPVCKSKGTTTPNRNLYNRDELLAWARKKGLTP